MLSEDARKLIFLSPVPTCNSQVCFGSSVAMNERTQRSFLTASGFLIRWRNTRFQIVSVFPRWRQNCSKASTEAFFIAKFPIFSTMYGFRKVSNPCGCLPVILQTCEFCPPPLTIFDRKTMSRLSPTLGQRIQSFFLYSPTYFCG